MWRYASESEDEPLSDTEIKEWESKLMSQRHPLTCGGDRGDQAHRDYQATHGGDLGELVKSDSGLVCPVCGWKQPNPLITLDQIERLEKSMEIAQLSYEGIAEDAVESLRPQYLEIERLKAGISQLTSIIEGMLSGNGHDPKEIEYIKTNYPLAFDLLIANGLLP